MSNSFGNIYKITTFGESHGKAIGVVIDGCPAGISIQKHDIQQALDKRKPGNLKLGSQRKESDEVEILSGVFENITTGMPIALLIQNNDAKGKDYEQFKNVFRPSHADFTYFKKFGIHDYKGGGRSSARETANWVAAGAIAKKIVNKISDIQIHAFVEQIGKIKVNKAKIDLSFIYENELRCANQEFLREAENYLSQIRKKGDTVGGIIKGVIKNCPPGIGEPIFNKLHAELGKAMLSINSVKGFEIGSGFDAAEMLGSEHNDEFIDDYKTKTNFSGGIQGGISNGMDIEFRIAFKPIATIMTPQHTIDKQGNKVIIKGKGRHDTCAVPRAVPIVEALSYLVMADFLLLNKLSKI